MNAKHTPGPWEYHAGDDYTVILGPGDSTDRPLADVFSDLLADAKLMAAAPELLEALHNMVALASPHFTDASQMLAIKLARAAISKATA